MIIEENVNLSKYTTLKIGGTAKKFYRPSSLTELQNLSKKLETLRILSGGSNLLINDEFEFDHVIYMGDYEKNLLSICEDGIITASSSIKIQQLIQFANKNGLGGAEYLYSLPALVGGIVAMNAGRGKSHSKSISDYILSVDVVIEGSLKTLSKSECEFSYRKSNLAEGKIIIHAVRFKFDKLSIDEGKKRIKERIDYSKVFQPINMPSAGSVFKKADGRIMRILRVFSREKSGLYFSKKTSNWITNGGGGTYKEAMKLARLVERLHRVLGKKIEVEWHIWSH